MVLTKKLRYLGAGFVVLSLFVSNFLFTGRVHATSPPPTDGVIQIILSQAPKTTTTVTATRSADIPDFISYTGKTIKAETVTLSGGCPTGITRRCSATTYSTQPLLYAGYSKADCGPNANANYTWQTWNISVTGGATGTAQVHIACGGVVTKTVPVTLASAQNTVGTIKGLATATDNQPCGSNSQYILVADGTGGGSYEIPSDKGTNLSIDASGNYTISNIKPGTYDLVINCVYGQQGVTVGQEQTIREQHVVVTAGKVTTVNLSTDPKTATGSASDAGVCGDGSGSWLCQLIVNNVVVHQIDTSIQNALEVDVKNVFCTSNSTDPVCANLGTGNNANYYKKAWASFRTIAIALLLIAGLVMVASQAFGFEFLDAYTVRKVLPRLFIAIIGIALSWYILAFFTQLINDLGHAIRTLIYSPFTGIHVSGNTVSLTNMTAGGVLLTVGGGIALGALGIASLFITAFLALAIGLLVLAVRQVVIVMLVITAPVAIAAYILPNTERIWKLWKDSFLGAMLMFPIISAFIAAGHAFTIIAFSSVKPGSTGSFIYLIMGFIAFFAPYFLLPATFRLATGALGSLAGMVNDRGRGMFDRLKGYRGNKMSENWQKTKGGSRFSNRNVLSRGASSLLGGAAAGPKGWMPTASGRARRATNRIAYQSSVPETNNRFKAWANDDGVMRALATGSNSAADAWANEQGLSATDRARRLNAVAIAKQIGINQGTSTAAFNRLGQMGYGFDGNDQMSAHDEMLATANRLSGGNAAMARNLVDNFEYNSKGAGRFDLSRGGEDQNAAVHDQMWSRWNNASLYQHANAKGASMQNFVQHFSSELALQGNDPETIQRRARAAQFFAEIKEMKPNTGGAVNEAINGALNDGLNQENLQRTYTDVGNTNVQLTNTPLEPNQTAQDAGSLWVGRQARHYERPDPNRQAEG